MKQEIYRKVSLFNNGSDAIGDILSIIRDLGSHLDNRVKQNALEELAVLNYKLGEYYADYDELVLSTVMHDIRLVEMFVMSGGKPQFIEGLRMKKGQPFTEPEPAPESKPEPKKSSTFKKMSKKVNADIDDDGDI